MTKKGITNMLKHRYNSKLKSFLIPAFIFLNGYCFSQSATNTLHRNAGVPNKAEEICPILVGQPLPKIILRTPDNSAFDINTATAKKPTLLIFYRGGWCPYCNIHLGQLQTIEKQLTKMGVQIIAVSADKPEKLKSAMTEHVFNFQLLSDNALIASRALGIAFRLDDSTVMKYKNSYGIDIEEDSGKNHHILPVPSVFLIGTDGIIHFSYVNPNYKIRADPNILLAAAKTLQSQSAEK